MTVRSPLVRSLVVAVALLASACAGNLTGIVNYDHTLDFSSIHKLAFYEDTKHFERPETDVRRYVRAQIDEVLVGRGYDLSSVEGAQLYVIYHVGTHSKVDTKGVQDALGRTATLAIEFRVPDTGATAWYGTLEQTWDERDKVDERVDTAIATLLEYFPPGAPGMRIKTSEGEQRISE